MKNTGRYADKETVQLYVRDLVGSVTRPVKELQSFRQIALQPGEEQEVYFTLGEAELGFYNADLEYVVELGTFRVMAGLDSKRVKSAEFELQ